MMKTIWIRSQTNRLINFFSKHLFVRTAEKQVISEASSLLRRYIGCVEKITNHSMQMNKKKELIKCFPLNLKEDVQVVIDKLIIKDGDIHEQTYNAKVNNTVLTIPQRIYFNEPASKNLTTIQKYILDCIFTRHHNGFVRQKHLRNLLFCTDYWITPFCFKLLGEYVKDILPDIKVQIENNIENYLCFISENCEFYNRTKSQMISYWDCYYREEYPNPELYIGFQIFSDLEKAYNKRINSLNGSVIR